MPQLITLALAGIGLWTVYKWLTKPSKAVAKRSRHNAAPSSQKGNAHDRIAEDLEEDPKTGIYGSKD